MSDRVLALSFVACLAASVASPAPASACCKTEHVCRSVDGEPTLVRVRRASPDDTVVKPGVGEVCGDGLDNDCDGAIDEDCTACDPASGIASFADDFDRADGPLGPDWSTVGQIAEVPALPGEISGGRACSTTQALGLLDACLGGASSTTVSFRFAPGSEEAKEAFAVFAVDFDGSGSVGRFDRMYFAGCGGGTPEPGETGRCTLTIGDVSRADAIVEGDALDLVVGAEHRLEATATATGELSVAVSNPSGDVLGTLATRVFGGLRLTTVGFVVGRDPDATTCLDEFRYAAQ